MDIVGRRAQRFVSDPGQRPGGTRDLTPTLELLVGDASGARAVIAVPFDRRSVALRAMLMLVHPRCSKLIVMTAAAVTLVIWR